MSAATNSFDISMTITFPDDTIKTVAATIAAELLGNGPAALAYVDDMGDRMRSVLTREAAKYQEAQDKK